MAENLAKIEVADAFSVTLGRGSFLKALTHVQSVVEKRTTLPILSNILLEARGSIFSIAATDLELYVHEKVPAHIEAEGSITVPAQILYDIVRKLPEDAIVELKLEGNYLKLKTAHCEFSLPTLPAKDFAVMTTESLPYTFRVSAEVLKNLLSQTRFAMSNEESRYYLNGIYLHVPPLKSSQDKAIMRAVATDGHRLALAETGTPEGIEGGFGIIIPRKTIGELCKILEQEAGSIKISLSDSKICFMFENILIASRLVDGTFPDYAAAIPGGQEARLVMDSKTFDKAVDRVAILANDKSKSIRLKVAGNRTQLFSNSTEYGSGQETLEGAYQGQPLEVSLNARYLLDVTQQITGKTIELLFIDANSPVLLRDPENLAATYIIMPMRG